MGVGSGDELRLAVSVRHAPPVGGARPAADAAIGGAELGAAGSGAARDGARETEGDAMTRARRQAARGVRLPQEARSKYHARKTTVDGVTFASGREAARFGEL